MGPQGAAAALPLSPARPPVEYTSTYCTWRMPPHTTVKMPISDKNRPRVYITFGAPQRARAPDTFKYTAYRADLMSVAGVAIWDPQVFVLPGGSYRFPAAPGVYVFAEALAVGFNVRYVGRAVDLQERIDAHFQGSGGNDCLRNLLYNPHNVRIRITYQPDIRQQMNVEHTCYMHYYALGHALCNTSVPKGTFLGGMYLPF